jgi:hypothetical protein
MQKPKCPACKSILQYTGDSSYNPSHEAHKFQCEGCRNYFNWIRFFKPIVLIGDFTQVHKIEENKSRTGWYDTNGTRLYGIKRYPEIRMANAPGISVALNNRHSPL